MYRTSEVVCVSAFIIKMCRKISNISGAKSQNFNVSRLGLQLSSDNILKPCVQLLQTHIKETSNYAFLALFGDSPMTSDFPSKGSAMWKMFPFDDIIMMGNNLSCTHFISSRIIDLTMNINPFPMVCCIWWYLYPPKRSLGGVYWIHPVRPSVCPSVCPSVRPSVRGSVSGW